MNQKLRGLGFILLLHVYFRGPEISRIIGPAPHGGEYQWDRFIVGEKGVGKDADEQGDD
jgi:hypothetical protein